jgi:hypothetical protein
LLFSSDWRINSVFYRQNRFPIAFYRLHQACCHKQGAVGL